VPRTPVHIVCPNGVGPLIEIIVKDTLHRRRGGADGAAGLEVVENLSQANESPVPGCSTFGKKTLDEPECLTLVNEDGRRATCLMAGDDERFCLAPIEFVRFTADRDQVAYLGFARLLNPKPSLLDAKIHLAAEPAQFAILDPRADDHVGINVPEGDRPNSAKRDESGRIADERHAIL
jgi:hypothetical protein